MAVLLPKIGATVTGDTFGLAAPPRTYVRVVTGNENIRHLPALPKPRPRILRILKQTVFETFFAQRLRLAEHTRQQPYAGVDQRKGRHFAAGKHEIAETDLLRPVGLDYPLVNTLITPAQQGNARTGRERPRTNLVEAASARREVDERQIGMLGPRRRDRRIDDVRPHHHARPAAERRIVDRPVPVAREAANVHRLQTPRPGGQRLAGQ